MFKQLVYVAFIVKVLKFVFTCKLLARWFTLLIYGFYFVLL